MFLSDRGAHAPQQRFELRVGAQRVEARVDAQPEEVSVAQLESLPELAEGLFPFAESEVDKGQAVGWDVAQPFQPPQLFEQSARLARLARDGEGMSQGR